MKRLLNILLFIFVIVISTLNVSYASDRITAISDRDYRVIIKDTMVDLPEDMTYLNYEDRVYVPLRFVSENMGLVVQYKGGKDIVISDTTENRLKESNYINQIESLKSTVKELREENANLIHKFNTEKPQETYYRLPITHRDKDRDFTIELYNVVEEHSSDKTTQLYFNVKNNSNYAVYIRTLSMVLEVDGKEYNARYNPVSMISPALYATLYPEFEKNVFVSMEMIPEDTKKANLTFEYEWIDKDEVVTVTMPIKLND